MEENRDKLELMCEALMQYETIETEQIDDIMAGKKPRPPKDWGDSGPTSGGTGASPSGNAPDQKSDKPAESDTPDHSSGGTPLGEH